MKESDEFSILEKYFKSLGNQFYDSSGILIGPGDDAGLFSQKKSDLIFSTDVSNAGIHFPKKLAPDSIAYRSCSVAASDIPACGGALKWLSISLVSPSNELSWLKKFTQGLKSFAKDYQVPVIGGDLIKGKECSVSVGVCGEVDRKDFLSRSGAKEGDLIFISGTLGLAKLGLKVLKSNKKVLSNKEKRYQKKFLKPKIQTTLGIKLRKIATSCIDISDGLVGDLGHICKQSNLAASIDIDSIPYEGAFEDALTWGDDYELCFTVPKQKLKKLNVIANKFKLKLFKIGEMSKGSGVRTFRSDSEVFLKSQSYNHFG